MQETIRESGREILVRGRTHVLVVGGGLGGVAAALGAARSGAKTMLVERNGFAGGVATAGMCCSIFNAFFTSSGKPGTGGVPLEIAQTFADMTGYGAEWKKHKGHIIYDIESAKLALDRLLLDAGVTICYDTLIAGTVVESNTVKGIIIESKAGREAILARMTVDATGDADVAFHAGVPLKTHANGVHSLVFRMGNVDTDAFVGYFRKNPEEYPSYMDVDWTVTEAIAKYDACGVFLFPHGGGMQMKVFQDAKRSGELPSSVGIQDTVDASQMHLLKRTRMAHIITGFTHFDGLDTEKISQSYTDGRAMAAVVGDFFRSHIPGFSDAAVVATADTLGVRTSRYLDNDFILQKDMLLPGAQFDDAVATTVYRRPVHKHPGKGAWCAWEMDNDTIEIPMRAITPRTVKGLLIGTGRTMSIEDPNLLRSMPYTMTVGHAAGIAAGVSIAANSASGLAPMDAIQRECRRQGILA